MPERNEKGEGGLQNFIWFLVLAAVVYAAWNLTPPYFTNYTFKDKIVEICRTPRPTTDEKILDMLMKEVREQNLYAYIGRQNFVIQTLETSRKISCRYDREVQVLPGWKRVVHFVNDVDQPLLY